MVEDWRALNRAKWDEWAGVHLAPGGYDLDALRAGHDRLNAIEEAELGSVAGLRILHLQCHFGRDSLILAGRGAAVTGVDFSGRAIEAARGLAAEMDLSAEFHQCDLYDAIDVVPGVGTFDLVYVTWGAICWLPDIAAWARTVAHFLKSGGALYFADAHPVGAVFDDLGGVDRAQRPGWFTPYFGGEPIVVDDASDYMNADAVLTNAREVTWVHPVGDILMALVAAGLRLEWLHEHPRITWRRFGCLVQDADGCWGWPGPAWLPLSLSLRAVRD